MVHRLVFRAITAFTLAVLPCLLLPVFAQSSLPVIKVFTEVRDGAEVLQDKAGNNWVENPASRLLEAVLEEAGLDYTVQVLPWARLFQNLESQSNSIGYTLVRTPERESRFIWLGLIRPIDSYLYGLSERADELPASIETLDDVTLGTIRGDVYDHYFQSLELDNVIRFGNNSPWLQMMERGRIDLMPYIEQGISAYLIRQGEAVDKLVPAVRLDELSTGLYFAMNLHSDEAVVEHLRQAYEAVVAQGLYQQIMGISHPSLENNKSVKLH